MTQQPPAYQPVAPQQPKQWSPLKILIVTVISTVAAVGVFAGILVLNNPTPKAGSFDVQVTSCDVSSGVAEVGFTVTNTGERIDSATVKIEYRDGADARLDTDTSYVENISPGDTVRQDESTILNASTDGTIKCKIVGVS